METMQDILKRYPRVVDKLYEEVVALDLDCADNFRIAKADDSWDRDRVAFDEVVEAGCCGSYNAEVVVDGVEYLIGCNYGH